MGEADMVSTTARSGVFTYEDFCALVGDGQKGDLIDGVIYMASPENIEANETFLWLVTVMNMYVRKKKLGKIHGSRVACRLDNKNSPEPDILFVAEKNRGRLHRGGLKGPPDLAIEIVSPDSVERDYDKKRRQYQRFRIPEYWIIDEHERKVTLLRLDARGKYREVSPRKGVFHSQALEGFWLDPSWLWHRPYPDEIETVQRLLGNSG
jgi:Uma2 family endonuclease